MGDKASERELTTEGKPGHSECIHQLFATQAARRPGAIAAVFEETSLTYHQLNSQANQLAHYLQTLGVTTGTPIGIYLDRSPAQVVACLAVLKAGGVCLPLTPAHPQAYLNSIVQASQASILLFQQPGIENIPSVQTISLEAIQEETARQSQANPDSNVTAGSPAYITYTSGNGISVTHGGFLHRRRWLQHEFALSDADATLYHDTVATAVWELFWPLTCGGQLIVAARTDPAYLWHIMREHNVSIAHFAPSALTHFLASEAANTAGLPALRGVLCSGEPLLQDTVEAFDQRLTARLYNLYAPPEAATVVTAQLCRPGQDTAVYPLGRPAKTPIIILDKHMNLVPAGVTGEIYLGGEQLADGYLHNADGAEHRFVTNPFPEIPGHTLFKTGDLGRWTRDDRLEMVGSTGRHIWRRGIRVDLGEIEAALQSDRSVHDSVVLIRQRAPGCQELVAYIVPAGPFSLKRLQTHLQETLPSILHPHAYVPVSNLPLTSQGQVDEQALTRLPVLDTDLAQTWEETLNHLPAIEQAVVMHQPQPLQPTWLHLSDLIPDWSAALPEMVEAADTPPASSVTEQTGPQAMAFADGGPMHIDENAPKTLIEALLNTAQKYPDKEIVHIRPDGTPHVQTYAQLLTGAKRVLAGLYAMGLKRGDRGILQLEDLRDHFVTFWACILGGIAPVTVAVPPSYHTENSIVNKIRSTWEFLDHPPILASDRLVDDISTLSESHDMPDLQVLGVSQLRDYPPVAVEQIHQGEPQEVVFFQLSSGSTGVPKCIQETHRGVIWHIHASAEYNGYTADDTILNWLPMDHVVPLLMYHVKDVYLGCRQIQVPTSMVVADPLRWLDLIETYQVTHTWAPNFAYKLVSDHVSKAPDRHWDLSSIKYFLNAGEQVTLPVVREFLKRMAPFNVAPQTMQPAYGMAELCTAMTYRNDFDLETAVNYFEKSSLKGKLRKAEPGAPGTVNFVEVGPPIAGVQIRIVNRENQVLPEGIIGRCQVRGPVVTPGYLNNEAANRDAFVGDGWFYTGDLAFILDGCLTITGREKEVIVIHGANFYCYEIEDVVNGIEGVKATYVGTCGIDDPKTGTEGLAIFFTPEAQSSTPPHVELINTIRREVMAQVSINPLYIVPVPQKDFPKTTSGKIQRTRLKKSLIAGEYQDILKEIDLYLKNANTILHWFYQKTWHEREPLYLTSRFQQGYSLVFLDPSGLGARLSAELNGRHQPCIQIEAGSHFVGQPPHHYQIDPQNPDHYRRLIESLQQDQISVRHIFHLWTYTPYTKANANTLAQAQSRGVYSLLFLIQALSQKSARQTTRLYLISSHVQPTSSTDRIAYEKSTLIGFLKTIPLELPWLRCRHIDLEMDQIDAGVDHILQELGMPNGHTEVAYRNGRRLVPTLAKVEMSPPKTKAFPVKTEGVYLITGGLGGIGTYLAQFLMNNYQAKLILVGRTVLPGREEWDTYLRQETSVSERIKNYLLLEETGGTFVYEAIDACDGPGLETAVSQAKTRWQTPLSGIIHLAGEENLQQHWQIMDDHWLTVETISTFQAAFNAKVYGTWTLHQLIRNHPQAIFISFSSVNSLFGGATFSAYAAANSFLDNFSFYQRRQEDIPAYCLNWTMWDDVGMSAGNPEYATNVARSMGYHILTKEQGIDALIAGLYQNQPHLIIGLDGTNQQIKRYATADPTHLQMQTAYFAAQTDLTLSEELLVLDVRDRYQTPTTCRFRQVTEIPYTSDGTIDYTALLSLKEGDGVPTGAVHVPPRTETEEIIATIWQEVLGIQQISIHDNFFELSGTSILAVQVQSKMQEAFDRQIAVVEMFQYPTISSMAQHLQRQQDKQFTLEQTQDRARSRRARREERLQRRQRSEKS